MKPEKDQFLGQRIREYEILDIIGEGGMGAVYRARHVYLDEERAIKVVHSDFAGEEAFLQRFIREGRMLVKLRHPNLVQLHEFGTLEGGTFFMVLELIQGESVFHRVSRVGRIPVPEAVRITREAALGLHAAHQKGIVHRDISPDNLMIVKDDKGREVTKVIDFGIAKPLAEETRIFTSDNMFLGKPEFCSPEQCGLLQEGEVIDHRSDIYSLGIVFYYMLSGNLPFTSRTPQGFLLKHLKEAPRPISWYFSPGEIPEPLSKTIEKTLAKKREERHSSMEELVQELDAIIAPDLPAGLAKGLNIKDLQPGDVFAGRFRIETKLGEGGMGVVFKAVDQILDVPVALKIMSSDIAENPKTVERFKREVILARRVAHRNVCRIYDIGEIGGIPFVSMELLHGLTLSEMIDKQGRIELQKGMTIIRQVLEALEEAHRAGIVHRDLKPQNVMVDEALRAFIMDFGISISQDISRVTETGVLIGTPYYMAPEQFMETAVDNRTDIYSAGVMMYQMFTGTLPFDAATPMGIVYAHLKSMPRKPSELFPEIPQALEAVMMKALQREAADRFQTVKEFIHALDSVLL